MKLYSIIIKATLVFLTTITLLNSSVLGIERRRDQYLRNEGYFLFPAPYRIPGIGEGFVGILYGGNFNQSTADAYGLIVTGDAEGTIAAIEELPLFTDHIHLQYQRMEISKFGVQQYSSRGMDTGKDDFSVLVGDRFFNERFRLSLNFWERRLNIYYEEANLESRLNEIRDKEGNIITEFETAQTDSFGERLHGVDLDYTDDLVDPKEGLRVEYRSLDRIENNEDLPEYTLRSYNISAFIPILRNSTWAFNYFYSDSTVTRKGLTDEAQIAANTGIQCEPGDSDCENALNETVQNTLNANKNGTAIPLGGPDRLRAYPRERFKGAFSEYFSTELRFNTENEDIPFDIVFMKDIQSALQFAIFWEQGSVSETRDELGKLTRNSYGMGGRLITGSGAIYRLDYAIGDEGNQTTIIFEYPWGISF